MIFRDDDIHFETDLRRFKHIDSLFIEYGIEHHIAVICHRMGLHTELIDYIHKHPHIIPQIHGWEHIDYTVNHNLIREHLTLCIKQMQYLGFAKPTIFFPPWNRTDDVINFVAGELGLIVLHEKNTLTDFIQGNPLVPGDIINFHYWADMDSQMLEPALRIERENRKAKT